MNSDLRSEQETWSVQEAEEAWEWGSVAADRTGMNLAVQVVGVNLLDQYNSYWIVRPIHIYMHKYMCNIIIYYILGVHLKFL